MGAWQSIVSGQRRDPGRVVALSVALLTLLGAGCGGHKSSTAESEKAADVAILDDALSAELTALAAWDRALAQLKGEALASGRRLRGHDQVHVDTLTKVIRGLDGDVEAEPEELEPTRPAGREEALRLAYEAEDAALAQDLAAPSRLNAAAPRAATAAIGASHAQNLVVLRQLLGVPLVDAVPQPYESGGEPPPGGG